MHPEPAVAVHLVVHNGASWLREILTPLMAQTYGNVRILLLDNASDDGTEDIVRNEFPDVRYIRRDDNLGIWARQQELLQRDNAPYVLVLTDVMLEKHYIERAVRAMENAPEAGAAQAKIYRADRADNGDLVKTDIIDTVGFRINRALKITNSGHGEQDVGQYDAYPEVFGVEGAAPFFRRSALEACRIEGDIIDPDYRIGGIGYGDDVDIAWRMRLLGFTHIYVPGMMGWHDRSTTKNVAKRTIFGQLTRLNVRKRIPMAKRRLDWTNVRFTIIKNAHASHLVRYAPWIITNEIMVTGYTFLFEPGVLRGLGRLFRLMPRMLARRREVMRKARTPARTMAYWFAR